MTVRKMIATLAVLGVRVRRESGGFALYRGRARRWAADLASAFDEGIDMGASGL